MDDTRVVIKVKEEMKLGPPKRRTMWRKVKPINMGQN